MCCVTFLRVALSSLLAWKLRSHLSGPPPAFVRDLGQIFNGQIYRRRLMLRNITMDEMKMVQGACACVCGFFIDDAWVKKHIGEASSLSECFALCRHMYHHRVTATCH